MTTLWAILWTDTDDEAHVRLVECTEAEADAAYADLRDIYSTADGGGFRHGRLMLIAPQSLAGIAEEVAEWKATE